jgi:hypothetical protein
MRIIAAVILFFLWSIPLLNAADARVEFNGGEIFLEAHAGGEQNNPSIIIHLSNKTKSSYTTIALMIYAGLVCNEETTRQVSFQFKDRLALLYDTNNRVELANIANCDVAVVDFRVLSAESYGTVIPVTQSAAPEITGRLAEEAKKMAALKAEAAANAEAERLRIERDQVEEAKKMAALKAEAAANAEAERLRIERDRVIREERRKEILSKTIIPNDIQPLVSRLIAAGATKPKGEFETSEAFKARFAALLKANDREYFFLKSGGAGDDFLYDADRAAFSLSVAAGEWQSPEKEHLPAITLKTVTRSTRQYVGSNAFGVKKLITEVNLDEYSVAVDFDSPIKFAGGSPTATVKMDPGAAQRLKPFLKTVVHCRLEDAHVYQDSGGWSATVSNPTDVNIRKYILIVRVLDIVFIDSRTGKPLASI